MGFVFYDHFSVCVSGRCIIRVLDSFGTEPDFNHADWAKKYNLKSPFGGLSLTPMQFYTMFRMCLLAFRKVYSDHLVYILLVYIFLVYSYKDVCFLALFEQLIHQTTRSSASWYNISWVWRRMRSWSPPREKTRCSFMGRVPHFGRYSQNLTQ